MTTLAFPRLLARRSVAITLGAIAVALGGVAYLEHTLGSDLPRIFLTVLYNAAAFILLISFGGFVGRALGELTHIRLSRVIPGLRRQATLSAALAVPVLSGTVTLLLLLCRPGQFHQVAPLTYWALAAFALALGLGLSGSWALVVVVCAIALKLPVLLPLLHTRPVTVELVALAGAGLCLGLRHVRFLPPLGSVWARFSWLRSPFVLLGRARDAGSSAQTLPPARPITPGLGVRKLMRAGVYERFGGDWKNLAVRTLFWVTIIDAIFGAILYTLATTGRTRGGNIVVAVLTSSEPTTPMLAARGLFAALTGCIAYISAVMLDTTLRPTFWHPVPRARLAAADFYSHLRQNLLFAGTHLTLTVIVITLFTAIAGVEAHPDALLVFALPSLVALVLMPIPQALFPNGADMFRRKVDPLLQLGAGLLGGLFSLLTVYWAFHWPVKPFETTFPPTAKVLLAVLAAAVSHLAYYACVRRRYARADLRRRTA